MVYVEVGIVLLIFAEFCGQLAMISSDILEKFGKFAARLSGKNPAILVSSTSVTSRSPLTFHCFL